MPDPTPTDPDAAFMARLERVIMGWLGRNLFRLLMVGAMGSGSLGSLAVKAAWGRWSAFNAEVKAMHDFRIAETVRSDALVAAVKLQGETINVLIRSYRASGMTAPLEVAEISVPPLPSTDPGPLTTSATATSTAPTGGNP
jgi:hypothetical protein